MVIFIDTDPGCDDIMALIYLLNKMPNEIAGVSSVCGNLNIDTTTRNLKLIIGIFIKEYNMKIPVYRGVSKPIVEVVNTDSAFFHGTDGCGHFFYSSYYEYHKNDVDKLIDGVELSVLPAAMGLIDMSKKYNDLTVVALGPLTNIALAQIIDPEFGSRVKEILIMGGDIRGQGNSEFHLSAEYNFNKDPEAAYVVFKEINCKKTILTLEPNFPLAFNEEMGKEWAKKLDTRGDLLGNIMSTIMKFVSKPNRRIILYDLILAIVIADPDVVTEMSKVNATVELSGRYNRGKVIVDHFDKCHRSLFCPFREVHIIKTLNRDSIELKMQTFFDHLAAT